jgi:hypothetical protein
MLSLHLLFSLQISRDTEIVKLFVFFHIFLTFNSRALGKEETMQAEILPWNTHTHTHTPFYARNGHRFTFITIFIIILCMVEIFSVIILSI